MAAPRYAFPLALCVLSLGGGLAAQSPDPRPWRAAGIILGVNGGVWGVNRLVKNEDWARVGPGTWGRNLRQGFEWDDDGFQPNQFAHPYHGSVYYGAARVNGLGYWTSIPLTMGGSLLWEYFGETKRPSLNDLVNTTMGGVALGEAAFRIAGRLRASPSGRPGWTRTLAAAVLSPSATLQPARADSSLEAAPLRRRLVQGYARRGAAAAGSHPYLALQVQGGSAFDTTRARAFDAFDLNLEVAGSEATIITNVRVNGLLGRAHLLRGDASQFVVAVSQRYDYANNSAYQWGGQSVTGGLLSRHRMPWGTDLRLGVQVNGTILGAISSEHAGRVGRTYDYGPGLGTTLVASLRRSEIDMLRLERTDARLRSLNGAEADHWVSEMRFGVQIPATPLFAVGTEVTSLTRQSVYRSLDPVSQRVSQVRAYIAIPRS